ncbi:hypothetical protein MVES1_001243 [Malassezia vespertilionis]|uniref:uncharacterized protein n=1 Tax=Malassezia vespertilionis TaxID=2020962 RepID=UPI0024B26CE8|nr:uncharacterized protein MVES1_001243 [Malassezia vespertilionis]WFD05909.1 hypothetical protein MVES1_001243 [Malassezia vespertilionis]
MATSLPLLSSVCQRMIARNLVSVQDIGDMPYRLARPFLQLCRPEQLRMLEQRSPHMLHETEELWRHACLRDFSELRKLEEAHDATLAPPSWRALYEQKEVETRSAREAAKARIKGRYAEHTAQKDAKKLVASTVVIKPRRGRSATLPRDRPMNALQSKGQAMLARARHGTAAQARRMMLAPAKKTMIAPRKRSGTHNAYTQIHNAAHSAAAPQFQTAPCAQSNVHTPCPPSPRPPLPHAAAEPAQSIFMPKRRIPSAAQARR